MGDNRPPQASAWLKLKRLLGISPRQATCLWCDCGNELVSDPRSDWYGVSDNPCALAYLCNDCGTITAWDFGYPVPVRVQRWALTERLQNKIMVTVI